MNVDVNKIIDEIEIQRYLMRINYKTEPNKIILGKKIYSVLMDNMINYLEDKDRMIHYIIGLPITIDYENIDTIEVCLELENNARNNTRNFARFDN